MCHALVSAQMGLTEHQGLVGAEGLGQATQWEELLQWMVQDGGLDALPAGLGFMQAVGCRLDIADSVAMVIKPCQSMKQHTSTFVFGQISKFLPCLLKSSAR